MSRGSRGVTLLEVMVVTVLLALTVGLTVNIYRQSLAVQRKTERRSDAYRTAVVVLTQLDQSLRGVRVDSAGPGRLQYQVPQIENGVMVVDGSGAPMFQDVQVVTLREGGELQRYSLTIPGQERTLARLGEDSTIDFVMNPDKTLSIQMSIYEGDDLGRVY